MGPRLVVDKSALQMMGREAFDEMTSWFDIVATPTAALFQKSNEAAWISAKPKNLAGFS